MTTTTREAQILTSDELPMITIVREFGAPPSKVFRAHTDPDWFVRWIGPDCLTSTVEVWDCRPGGEWRYHSTMNGETFGFRGCFHDVRPDQEIVQTFTFEGAPEGVTLERLRLEDLGDGRTRLVATSLGESFEGRDAMLASGMEAGVQDGYRKLDDLLAE